MTTLSRVFPGVEVIVDRLVPVHENNRGVVSTADATERAPRQMHVVMNKTARHLRIITFAVASDGRNIGAGVDLNQAQLDDLIDTLEVARRRWRERDAEWSK